MVTFDQGEELVKLWGKTGDMYYAYIDQLRIIHDP